jgi:hypothetical protein
MKKVLWIVLTSIVLLSLIGSSVLAQGLNPGTGKTNIFMQNLGAGNAQVTVKFYRQDTGALDWDYTIPNAIPSKGAAQLLYPNFQVGDNWAGAAELASTEPIAAIVNMFWGDVRNGAAYSGIDAPATEAYLPNLLKRDDLSRQTRVTVQNTEATQANVVMRFYNRNGLETGVKNDTIPAKAEKTYNLDNVAEANFNATLGTGSLYITSNTKIAVMASLHYPDGAAAYSGVSRGDTVLWVPGVFRRQGSANWTTGAIYSATVIQNLGASPAQVTFDLIGKTAANASTSFTDTIPPKASYAINTMTQATMPADKWNAAVAALGTNWLGTIKATCTNGQPLAGVSLYFNKGRVSDLIAYEAVRNSDATTNALSMPAVYRKMGVPQWSTTLVQNLDNTPATINVKFFKGDGTQAGAVAGYNVNIPANGSVGLNLLQQVDLPQVALNDIGNDFFGAMYVTSTSGNHIVGNTLFFIENSVGGVPVQRALGYSGFPVP